jgi:NCAIR mutase (PurE)-related protein|tara:strand:+ start:630 stop:1175 length:546 start_codon:yes stop_codon:yes gene_type:complete
MPCALTTGFTLDCKDAIGGVKSVRLTTLAEYEALDASVANGKISSWGTPSTVFFKYDQLKETSSLTETINSNVQNGSIYYTPEVTIVLSKLESDKRNEIKLLAQNRLVAIVETNDETPKFFVVGVTTGLEVSAGTSATGTAYSDLSGYNLTLSGLEAAPMLQLDPADATLADDVTSSTTYP